MWNDDEDPWATADAVPAMEEEVWAEQFPPPPDEDDMPVPEEDAPEPFAGTSVSSPQTHSPGPLELEAAEQPTESALLPVDMAQLDNETTPAKKRLRGKQPPPPAETPVKQHHHDELSWAGADGTPFDKMEGRARYMKFWNKWLFWKRQRRRVATAEGDVQLQTLLEGQEGKSFKIASNERDLLWDQFLTNTRAPPAVMEFLMAQYPRHSMDMVRLRHSRSALLTWNGAWGECADSLGKSLSPAAEPGVLDENTLQRIREHPSVVALWVDFLSWMNVLANDTGAGAWACALEVCTRALKEEGRCRIHAHAFLKRDRHLAVTSLRRFAFRGCMPHCGGSGEQAGKMHARGSWCGCYYLQVAKIGTLYSQGNKQPYVDYPVNPSWIFNLLQGGKVSNEVARREVLRSPAGITRRLADLEKWMAEQREEVMRGRVAETQVLLAKVMRPFPEIPKVVAWQRKFSGACTRKKFLVLEGASGLGKTEYARSLFGVERTLELNCAGSLSFCLREHEPLRHRCILWDEAQVQLVLQERKLFQCPACWVQLGASPTGSHVYKVWLNDTVMIVGSNSWTEQLERTPKQDADWIIANQVLVQVKEPLWHAPAT